MTKKQLPKLLAVGPLPPPFDGPGTSFELFCREVQDQADIAVLKIVDSSPKRLKSHSYKLAIADIAQAKRILGPFCKNVASVDQVLIFGSNGFLLRMAPLLLIISKMVGKPCHIRAFGGSLDNYYASLHPILQSIFSWMLQRADSLIVQTVLLHQHFQATLGDKVHLAPGYRQLPDTASRSSTPATNADGGLRLAYVGHVREEKGDIRSAGKLAAS